MTGHSRLLFHEGHGHLGAQQNAQQIDLDDGFDLCGGHVAQIAASPVDAGVVDPVLDGAQIFDGKLAQPLDRGGVAHVALRGVDLCGTAARAVFGLQGVGGRRAVLDVANDHVVAAVQKFTRVGVSDAARAARNDDAALWLWLCFWRGVEW